MQRALAAGPVAQEDVVAWLVVARVAHRTHCLGDGHSLRHSRRLCRCCCRRLRLCKARSAVRHLEALGRRLRLLRLAALAAARCACAASCRASCRRLLCRLEAAKLLATRRLPLKVRALAPLSRPAGLGKAQPALAELGARGGLTPRHFAGNTRDREPETARSRGEWGATSGTLRDFSRFFIISSTSGRLEPTTNRSHTSAEAKNPRSKSYRTSRAGLSEAVCRYRKPDATQVTPWAPSSRVHALVSTSLYIRAIPVLTQCGALDHLLTKLKGWMIASHKAHNNVRVSADSATALRLCGTVMPVR